MITTARIAAIRDLGGVEWISALRAPDIKKLANDAVLQMSLFDEANLAEISHIQVPLNTFYASVFSRLTS